MIKFYSKKDKEPYKEAIYEQWEGNKYWAENRVKVWMSRNSDAYTLCLGFWLLEVGKSGPMSKIRFKAADPHWVAIDMSSINFDTKEEFKDYLTQHNITWL